MKRAILALTFVFAVSSLSAQTKNKKPKSPEVDVQKQLASQPQNQIPLYIIKVTMQTLNAIIVALQTTQDMDAKTSNMLINHLIQQANDTTVNKPMAKQPGQ